MNTVAVAPEVLDFLEVVRAQLADLDPDEQREILDGLEADLTDLVAERGGEALGDPVAYARELRAAAGLEPQARRARQRLDLAARVHRLLDACHRQLDRRLAALPGDAHGFLRALRPGWWVLRGWIAVQVVVLVAGAWKVTIVPGEDAVGAIAVLVGVVLSVQIGRGRLWPDDGWHRVALARTLLLAVNCVALAAIPAVLNGMAHARLEAHRTAVQAGFRSGFHSAAEQAPVKLQPGLYADGRRVTNIYPYDAEGRPLVGVQLFDQTGEPINAIVQAEVPEDHCVVDDSGRCTSPADGAMYDQDGRELFQVPYPWTNGAAELLNVFPIPGRLQVGGERSATAFTEDNPPAIGVFPLASVPKVSLPGVEPGVVSSAR